MPESVEVRRVQKIGVLKQNCEASLQNEIKTKIVLDILVVFAVPLDEATVQHTIL